MIAYFPEIYPDESMYSWICRYYMHTGYPNYVNVMDDLLVNRAARISTEFYGRLKPEVNELFEKMYGLEYLIQNHTLYPQYARFCPADKRAVGLENVKRDGQDCNTFRVPIHSEKIRHMKYCPLCADEDRQKYGEAYWHREWQLRGINICTKHSCYLAESDVIIHAKASPRLHPAEAVIAPAEPIYVKNLLEQQFSNYLVNLFRKPLSNDGKVQIGDYLKSRLEGTPYISARGVMMRTEDLFQDIQKFYAELPNHFIDKRHTLQWLFSGKCIHYYEVCQIAYFLGISVDELDNPVLPEKSQTERFNERVAELYAQGKGCYRAAREVGSCPSTALKANRKRNYKQKTYDGNKGKHRQDWHKLDDSSAETVRRICQEHYDGNGDRPHKVTRHFVEKAMGWPVGRLRWLPRCSEIVAEYEESQEEYWAREIEWVVHKLKQEERIINISQIYKVVNMRRENVEICLPYVGDKVVKELIQSLLL